MIPNVGKVRVNNKQEIGKVSSLDTWGSHVLYLTVVSVMLRFTYPTQRSTAYSIPAARHTLIGPKLRLRHSNTYL